MHGPDGTPARGEWEPSSPCNPAGPAPRRTPARRTATARSPGPATDLSRSAPSFRMSKRPVSVKQAGSCRRRHKFHYHRNLLTGGAQDRPAVGVHPGQDHLQASRTPPRCATSTPRSSGHWRPGCRRLDDEWTESRRYMCPEILAACRKAAKHRMGQDETSETRLTIGAIPLKWEQIARWFLIHHPRGRGRKQSRSGRSFIDENPQYMQR